MPNSDHAAPAPQHPERTSPHTYLGFDYGERRTGVALAQTLSVAATPLTTLERRGTLQDWATVADLIAQWQPVALIVGLPRLADGHRHPMSKQIHRFCAQLRDRFELPVHTLDESYSSAEAYARLKAQRRAGRRRRIARTEIDRMAAAVMLESWLSTHHTPGSG
jgi:putative Holliday junction resolvase